MIIAPHRQKNVSCFLTLVIGSVWFRKNFSFNLQVHQDIYLILLYFSSYDDNMLYEYDKITVDPQTSPSTGIIGFADRKGISLL